MAKRFTPAQATQVGGLGPRGYPVTLRGLDTVCNNLRVLAAIKKENMRPAMGEIITLLMRESMDRTPIRTGALRASHRCKVTGTGRRTVGTVWVVGNLRRTQPNRRYYALYVHEAPPWTKFRSPWPRGRKFLERAFMENIPQVRAIIAKWLIKTTKGTTTTP